MSQPEEGFISVGGSLKAIERKDDFNELKVYAVQIETAAHGLVKATWYTKNESALKVGDEVVGNWNSDLTAKSKVKYLKTKAAEEEYQNKQKNRGGAGGKWGGMKFGGSYTPEDKLPTMALAYAKDIFIQIHEGFPSVADGEAALAQLKFIEDNLYRVADSNLAWLRANDKTAEMKAAEQNPPPANQPDPNAKHPITPAQKEEILALIKDPAVVANTDKIVIGKIAAALATATQEAAGRTIAALKEAKAKGVPQDVSNTPGGGDDLPF